MQSFFGEAILGNQNGGWGDRESEENGRRKSQNKIMFVGWSSLQATRLCPTEEPWRLYLQVTLKKAEGGICSLAPVSPWLRVTLWDSFLTLPICHCVRADWFGRTQRHLAESRSVEQLRWGAIRLCLCKTGSHSSDWSERLAEQRYEVGHQRGPLPHLCFFSRMP